MKAENNNLGFGLKRALLGGSWQYQIKESRHRVGVTGSLKGSFKTALQRVPQGERFGRI